MMIIWKNNKNFAKNLHMSIKSINFAVQKGTRLLQSGRSAVR